VSEFLFCFGRYVIYLWDKSALEPHFVYTFGLGYSSALKMTSVHLSETLVSIYPTSQFQIPDDTSHSNHCSENLSSEFVASLPSLKSQTPDAVASRHVTETQILLTHFHYWDMALTLMYA